MRHRPTSHRPRSHRPQSLHLFFIVWLGQLLSLLGSALTAFALGLWVVERCQAATPFALIALCTVLPMLVLSPLAGVMADRHDRRHLMLLSDAGAGLATLSVALLLHTGQLQVWHIYLAAAATGICGAFQQPAYLAATTLLVPARQLGRAAGMVQMAQAAADIIAPALAGVLILVIRLQGVVLIDLATFLVAMLSLLLVRFPAVDHPPESGKRPSLLSEMVSGWNYIAARPGLLALLALLAITNLASGTIGALLVPMLMTFTTADVTGTVISVAGGGMLGGSLLMSLWGGPRRRIRGVLGCDLVKGLGIVVMALRPSAWLVALGATAAHVAIPVADASRQAIWQAKVPAVLQGRVFATRQMIARAAMPLAFLVAGPLADRVLEPLMAEGAPLAARLEWLLGSGPGRGMALLFAAMGGLIAAISLTGSLLPRIRRVEDELPDA